MSIVTNLILSFSIAENEKEIERSLKRFESVHHAFNLVSINDNRLPRKWYGGGKMFEKPVYIGAFNNFPVLDFILFLKHGIDWEYPEDVELFELTEGDEKFTIHYLDKSQLPKETKE